MRCLFAFLLVVAALAAPPTHAQPACEPGEMQGVSFRHGSDRPMGELASQAFRNIVWRLDACPALGIVVTTFVDDTEPPGLGEQRARAISEALADGGILTPRLVARSRGLHPDSDSAARPAWDPGDSRVRWATVEAVALADLPRGAPDLSDPDPLTVDLWQDGRLRLDWAPATADAACADGAPLVLRGAAYNGVPLDVGCLAADSPATYTDASTAKVSRLRRGDVTVIDGQLGDVAVGWVVGPEGSVQTDGRFCSRYLAAVEGARRALAALVVVVDPNDAPDSAAMGDGVEERAALERAALALLPFLDAVAAVGGEVDGIALDCRALTFEEYSH